MRNNWRQQATPSPVSMGVWTKDDNDQYAIFRNGAYYRSPNSLLVPSPGAAMLSLDFGFGQSLSLDFGGFYAQYEPKEIEP